MDKITVSVCMITYGHEQYIKEAIESVLMQSADFEYELIIADDCSPDATEKVVKLLIETHENGHRIKYIKHQSNLGMMPNFEFALKQCKGKYIALCDGDDYWTDPLKLQKQVDFLEANPDFSICFHKVKILRGEEFFDDKSIEARYDRIKEHPATMIDLLEQGNFIHTPSVMFRNYNINFPFEFERSTVGDYFLHIINSQHGPIKRLDEIMAVYREGVGIYSTLSSTQMQEKILIYQTCLLSYLSEDEHKEIIYEKVIKNIEALKKNNLKLDYLSSVLSLKKITKLFILKIKTILRK